MEREREHKQGQVNTYYRTMYEQVRTESDEAQADQLTRT